MVTVNAPNESVVPPAEDPEKKTEAPAIGALFSTSTIFPLNMTYPLRWAKVMGPQSSNNRITLRLIFISFYFVKLAALLPASIEGQILLVGI